MVNGRPYGAQSGYAAVLRDGDTELDRVLFVFGSGRGGDNRFTTTLAKAEMQILDRIRTHTNGQPFWMVLAQMGP